MAFITGATIALYRGINGPPRVKGQVSQDRFSLRMARLQTVVDCGYNVITMRAEIVRIGNSRGIRIPKPVIEECGFGDKVEIKVENRRLIISPESGPREGWEQMFSSAGDSKEDETLFESVSNEFDHQEWTW